MIVGFKGRYETEKGEAAWSLESMAAGGTWFWRFRHWVATGNWAAVQGGIRQGACSKTGNGVISVKFKRGAAREGGEEDSATGQYWASRGKFRSLKSKLATETFRPEIGGERAARFHHVSICVHNTCLIQQTLMFIDVADKATVTAGYSGHYFDTDAHLTST